jgi:hypothetical protein
MNVPIFIAGFVGALAPEIVRLYELRRSPQTFQPWYYAVSIVYALLGGYVATLLPGVASSGQLWWAFAVGAGLNAVVSLAAKLGATLAGGRGATSAGGPPPAAAARDMNGGSPPAKGTMGDFWRAL